jgi:hypothetical protein
MTGTLYGHNFINHSAAPLDPSFTRDCAIRLAKTSLEFTLRKTQFYLIFLVSTYYLPVFFMPSADSFIIHLLPISTSGNFLFFFFCEMYRDFYRRMNFQRLVGYEEALLLICPIILGKVPSDDKWVVVIPCL